VPQGAGGAQADLSEYFTARLTPLIPDQRFHMDPFWHTIRSAISGLIIAAADWLVCQRCL
jgi:hypothetical protein